MCFLGGVKSHDKALKHLLVQDQRIITPQHACTRTVMVAVPCVCRPIHPSALRWQLVEYSIFVANARLVQHEIATHINMYIRVTTFSKNIGTDYFPKFGKGCRSNLINL